MTFVTGIVDAVSYLGFGGVFTANMTGNIILLGFAVAGVPSLSIARPVTSLLAFLAGAIVGGRLGRALANANRRRWFLIAAVSEAVLLFAAALACFGLTSNPSASSVYVAIVLTAVAMGLRTVTVRRLAVPDITTTVVTTTVAALAADSYLAGGNNERVGRRVGSVLSLLAGAAIGAILLRFGLTWPLLFGGVLVLAASAYASLPSPSGLGREL